MFSSSFLRSSPGFDVFAGDPVLAHFSFSVSEMGRDFFLSFPIFVTATVVLVLCPDLWGSLGVPCLLSPSLASGLLLFLSVFDPVKIPL